MTGLLRLPQRLLEALRRRPLVQLIVALVFGFSVGIYTMGPAIHAGWSVIDDHEIALFMGPRGRLTLSRFWLMLRQTEAWKPGGGPRYRPSYYFARLVETAFWGGHPGIWYGARMVFFSLILAAVVWTLRRRLSLFENLFLALVIAMHPLWVDVFARLGPAEAYCALGSAIFAVGFELALVPSLSRRRAWLSAFLVCLGGVLAVGSKENFLVLLAPTAYLAWRVRAKGPARWVLGACLTVAAFTVFVGVSAYLGVKHHGHVYKEDVSTGGRSAVLIASARALWLAWKKYLFCALVVLAAAVASLAMRTPRFAGLKKLLLQAAGYATVVAGLAVLLLSQHVFYNGKWPSAVAGCCGRYDFPGLLVASFAVYVGVCWLLQVFDTVGVPRWPIAWVRIGLVVWLVMGVWPPAFPLAGAARTTVGNTKWFTSKLETIRDTNREHPDRAFVLESYNIWDFEPVVSFQRFMGMYRVRAPIFLKLHYASNGFAAGSLERHLAEELEEIAAKGDPNGTFAPMQPWSAYRGPPCYAIGFAGGGASTGCTFLLGM